MTEAPLIAKNKNWACFAFLLFCLLLLISTYAFESVEAKEYFIDAKGMKNGKGSKLSPWNNLSQINSLKPGDIAYLTGEFKGESLVVNSSGTKINPITFQQWNERDPWKINGLGLKLACIEVRASNIRVLKVEVFNAANKGVLISGAGLNNILIEKVISHNNVKIGIEISNYSDAVSSGDIFIKECEAYENGTAGFSISGHLSNVYLVSDEAYKNGIKAPGHGFSSMPIRKRLGGLQKIWPGLYSVKTGIRRITSILDRKNRQTFRPHTGSLQTMPEATWKKTEDTLYIRLDNAIQDPDIYVVYAPLKNIIYYNCIAHHNVSFPGGYIEGHGFSFDDFSSDSIAIGCKSYANEGHGFMNHMGDRNTFISCKAWGNNGDGIRVAPLSNDIGIFNTTLVGNRSGIKLWSDGAETIKNNVIIANREYGVSINTDNNFAANQNNYNCLSSNRKGNVHGFMLGNKSIETTDLNLENANDAFLLNPQDYCMGKGVSVILSKPHQLFINPNRRIGAYKISEDFEKFLSNFRKGLTHIISDE